MEKILKRAWPDIVMVVLFLALSFAYFHVPVSQGLTLSGHDSDAAIGQGKEQADYRERHGGETSRWTNAMFCGMPTYQISPSYGPLQFLDRVARVYELGTTGALCYLFVFLLGFYILMRAFNFRPYLAALGAIVWAFSSYFFIIIAAGHIWKVMTLAFIPPTIGGLLLCYRGRLLRGGAVTALFTALQVLSNHVQMSYYFLFVMALVVVAYGIAALRRRGTDSATALTPRRWLRATGVVVVAGLLGVAANLPNLYHTYTYARHTMRGGCELTAASATAQGTPTPPTAAATPQAGSGGLDYDYITQWSYGVDETLTLLIPQWKGGGSGSALGNDEWEYTDDQTALRNSLETLRDGLSQVKGDLNALPGLNAYWGNQPFTVGPVYVGAFVCLLFFLGLFIVRGPLKWALAAATLLSLLFAWGHHLPAVTHFLIDHLPLYNKFRTVSSALVIAEFTLPLLGLMALAEVLRHRDILSTRRGRIGLAVSTVVTAGTCLVLYLFPSVGGPYLSADEAACMATLSHSGFFDAATLADYGATVQQLREGIVAASAGRSLLVLLLSLGVLVAALRWRRFPAWGVCALLGVIALVDMWSVNRRYLNDDNFTDPVVRNEQWEQKSEADEYILRDTTYYRVLDLSRNTFNDNTASYWHHNVGGYHAAKLQRYQDIIERQLTGGRRGGDINALIGAVSADSTGALVVADAAVCPVLNMLNAKYVIVPTGEGRQGVVTNPYANGNGWFVRRLHFVSGADAEMGALDTLDTKLGAVADASFRPVLDGGPLGDGSVRFVSYEANELHYDIHSEQGGVVVFSEIYYPGWTATIDGREAEIGRVNYVLRALRVPAGSHRVVLTFRPTSVTTTNAIAWGAIAVILLLFAAALWRGVKQRKADDHRPA